MSETRGNLKTILHQLCSATRACKIYSEGHPSVHTPMMHLSSSLATIFQTRDRIKLYIVDDVLVLDEIPFYEANEEFESLYEALKIWDVATVTFRPGVTLTELEVLSRVLSSQDEEKKLSIVEEAEQNPLPHIEFQEIIQDQEDPRAQAAITYEDCFFILIELLSELRLGKIPSERPTELLDHMKNLILTTPSALLGLTLLKNYDRYTYIHSINTALFSLAFARAQNFDPESLQRVTLAALLHDVGKVRTAEAIIKKPGALTDNEFEAMKMHPELSWEMLGEMFGIDEETREIVLEHHLRYDGTGYPQLPEGKTPHPHSVIVSLADCYDALTTTRPYQKSRHPGDAVRIMRRLGGKAYANEIISDFVNMLGTYPVGELVQLQSRELAVIANLNRIDATSPDVLLVADESGRKLSKPEKISLAENANQDRGILFSIENPLDQGIDVLEVLQSI